MKLYVHLSHLEGRLFSILEGVITGITVDGSQGWRENQEILSLLKSGNSLVAEQNPAIKPPKNSQSAVRRAPRELFGSLRCAFCLYAVWLKVG